MRSTYAFKKIPTRSKNPLINFTKNTAKTILVGGTLDKIKATYSSTDSMYR